MLKLLIPKRAEYPDQVSVIDETIIKIRYGINSLFINLIFLIAKKTGNQEKITDIRPIKN